VVNTQRYPVQQRRAAGVAAVAGDKVAQRDLPDALRVTPRNHFGCSICGRTLMTGERAQRDTLHGHEPEIICELCQRKRAGSTGKSRTRQTIEARKRAD
jgi:hypothetical protein